MWGFKSLADVSAIPVRQPTIIKEENDGGKSSALKAFAFLIGERIPAPEGYVGGVAWLGGTAYPGGGG